MVNEISQKMADEIIFPMEQHLRNEILKDEPSKLWEESFIKCQIERRNKGKRFTLKDHIRAMVYSMLSSGTSWDRVAKDIDPDTKCIIPADEIFCDYDVERLLVYTTEQLRDAVKSIGCGTSSTRKQMEAILSNNIPQMITMEKENGTIDTYYQKFIEIDSTLKTLIIVLSTSGSIVKLEQMNIALVCEYLRNVGYDIPKPDRHICRILGSDYLSLSDKKTVPPFEAFDIVVKLAQLTGKPVAEVDYILWSYCAKGYGKICTVNNPKCDKCVAYKLCERKGKES